MKPHTRDRLAHVPSRQVRRTACARPWLRVPPAHAGVPAGRVPVTERDGELYLGG